MKGQMETHHIRPLAPLPADAELIDALKIAGGSTHFSAAEVIARLDGRITRVVLSAGELKARSEPHIGALLARLAEPRADVGGLALDRPRIMGIVNVTPDSFSDGGQFNDPDKAIAHGLKLAAEGADILDIGGESTRPGARPIDPEEECQRVIPVIAALRAATTARISVDTRNSLVMQRAIAAGAHLVNDVSALTHDPESLKVVAAARVPVVLMHMLGTPETMQARPVYDDVVLDVADYLARRIAACEAVGVPRSRIIVDPGIGFGKTLTHNLALIGALSLLHGLGVAVLLGASRKSFIVNLMTRMGAPRPETRLPGSVAAALEGARQGVQILRVHDVAETRQALAVAGLI